MEAPATTPLTRSEIGPHSYEEYLALPDDGRIVEWVDGAIIYHMPPTPVHQRIASTLETLLKLYVKRLNLGEVFDAPIEVRLWPGGPSREPDVLFVRRERLDQLTDKRFEGAPDLVIEVVSPTSVTIDRVDKYLEYERAGVREYWIIDPRPRQEQADFYIRGESGRFEPAPVDEAGVYVSTVIPGFRLQLDWLRRPDETDVERALAWMLADSPAISEDLRAAYRGMLGALESE
jgi:Uma2 family endonuclease